MTVKTRHLTQNTHTNGGLAALRSDRTQRVSTAKAILADPSIHSDARVRRACKTILNNAPGTDHADHALAQQLLKAMAL